MKYEILNSRLETLEKLINKINKKGGEVTYVKGESFFKEVEVQGVDDLFPHKVVEEFTSIELEATYKIEGFTPVALIDHFKEGNIVTPFLNGYIVDKKYFTQDAKCDHCNTNRKRNKTILIKKGKDLRQVGLSCLKDYTGYDASFLAMISQYIKEIEEALEFDSVLFSHDVNYISVVTYLSACFHAYKENNKVYVKTYDRWEQYNPFSTKEEGLKLLGSKEITEEDKQDALEAVEFLREFPEDYDNSYSTNLKTLTSTQRFNRKYAGYVASAITFKERELLKIEQAKARKMKMASKFQGEIKTRLTLVVDFKFLTSYSTFYGDTFIYEMLDADSNVYIWKTSIKIENGRYAVKGTVKEHNVYNNINQTILTRCKIVKEEA